MIRTQIQLDEKQVAALHRLAAERRISMAALIREGVELLLSDRLRTQSWDVALKAIGKHRGKNGNVGEEHDRHLDEAFGS